MHAHPGRGPHARSSILGIYLSILLAVLVLGGAPTSALVTSLSPCDYVSESLEICRSDTVCRLTLFLDGDVSGADDGDELADPRLFAYLLDKHVIGDSRSPERRAALVKVLERTGNLCNSSDIRSLWLAVMSQARVCGPNEYYDSEKGCTCRTGKTCGTAASSSSWAGDLLSINLVVLFVMLLVVLSVVQEIAKQKVQMQTIRETWGRVACLESHVIRTTDQVLRGGLTPSNLPPACGDGSTGYGYDPYTYRVPGGGGSRVAGNEERVLYEYHSHQTVPSGISVGARVGGSDPHSSAHAQGGGATNTSSHAPPQAPRPKVPEVDPSTHLRRVTRKIHGYSTMVEGREEAGRTLNPSLGSVGVATPVPIRGQQQQQHHQQQQGHSQHMKRTDIDHSAPYVDPQIRRNILTQPMIF